LERPVSLLGTLSGGEIFWKEGRNWREEGHGGESGGGFTWAKGEMRQAWFELRVGGFVMRRTRVAVPLRGLGLHC